MDPFTQIDTLPLRNESNDSMEGDPLLPTLPLRNESDDSMAGDPLLPTLPLRNESDYSMEGDPLLPVQTKTVFHYAVLALATIVITVGTIGNSISLSVFLYYRRLRKRPFNIIIIFLTVEDLISCAILTPVLIKFVLVNMSTGTVNTTLCLMSVYLWRVGKFGSIFALVEIAIIRLLIVFNRTFTQRLLSKGLISFIITFNVIVVQVAGIWRSFISWNFCDIILTPRSSIIGTMTTAIAIFSIMILCYSGIACYTKKKFNHLPNARNDRRDRYDFATIQTCVVVTIAFVVFHLPLFVYCIINMNISSLNIMDFIFYGVFNLFSPAGNPIIMFCTCTEFRKHVFMFMRMLFRKMCRSNNVRVAPADLHDGDVIARRDRRIELVNVVI